jgi:acetyl esterase/lipase
MKDHPEVPPPAGGILISAWLDPSHRNTDTSPFSNVDFVYGDGTSKAARMQAVSFAGGRDISSPEISLALSTDLKGVAPHLCCYGDAEVLHEHSRTWIEQCKLDGVDVTEYAGKGAIHTFPLGGLTADSPTERLSDDILLSYIAKRVGR